MRRSGSSGPLRIHLIAASAPVSERTRRTIDMRSSWSLTQGADCRFPPQTDVVLIPASLCANCLSSKQFGETGPSIIAYGAAQFLESCYLRGCDDYLKDPWDGDELAFRLSSFAPPTEFFVGNVKVRVESDRLISEMGTTGLTDAERALLGVLINRAGLPVPREALFYAVWGVSGGASRLVDVYVSRLRSRLREVGPPGHAAEALSSIRGVGYSLKA